MIFAVAVGIPVGVLAAVKRGSIFDHTAVGLALTGYSMPIFWWGHDADHAGLRPLEPDAGFRARERYGVP
ncbi:dipeptide transporter permease DppB [Salmonella enterica subsp. enterica]|uniref:Dipeptide transporter permease DppB n=1 Tax=Salmonella enterica I TaxID=59201 RepID=A0A379VIS0_SALET|nr:dipeptide transporter permease DppB [Salmonella enterica subsp. enterica]